MKQVIVVNEALKLPRGKLSAQVAHAAVGSFLNAPQAAQRNWLGAGMPKVVVRGESECIPPTAPPTHIPSTMLQ